MKTKYANLIEQLERVTEDYEAALAAVKALEAATGELPDVLGVSGGVTYLGDRFEKGRAIHLDEETLAVAALDCGSDFSHEHLKKYTRIECTLFGYRVFSLVAKDSAQEAYLLDLAVAEENSNE